MTSDGKRISYIARHSGSQKSNLVICNSDLDDCWTGNAYDALSPIRTDLSGFHLSYIATKGKKQGVITVNLQESGLKETESNWYDKIQSFEISEGGGYLAFLATQGEQDLLVKNGAETRVPHYDSAFDIAVSKQGQVIYTAMVKNSVRAYLDGRRVGSDYAEINAPVFSPDGGNYAYVVKKGEKYAVAVNGKEGPSFDMAVEPRFSPDGSRVVYRARNRGERFVVVGDTKAQTVKEHPHYEAVWRVNFAPDGKSVAYGVKMGQQFWWKHENL
ncbi:TolB family protein [Geotalea toluenoxydans]|uniref:TolB family protein n=1 Tax=Geotalea toluenoxydans TaxID=421624 RepID=UPI000A654F5F|nr:hypothetical protein [Geotalea toluenoxydans]